MNNKDFLFISSNVSSSFHPANKICNFIVELPERINLVGKWAMGLRDFFLTKISSEVLYIFTAM